MIRIVFLIFLSFKAMITPLKKNEQLENWLIFQKLLTELEEQGLGFNRRDLNNLKSRATSAQLKVIADALAARDKLAYSNQALVIKMAEQYSNDAISTAELIQQGNLGLMRAMVKFSPHKNAKFSSYAYFWVKALIFEALYKIDPIYIPPKIRKELRQSYGYISLDKEARTMEIAADTDCSLVNEVMLNLTSLEQDVLNLGFNLDGTAGSLSVALALGCSLEAAQKEVDSAISNARILSKI